MTKKAIKKTKFAIFILKKLISKIIFYKIEIIISKLNQQIKQMKDIPKFHKKIPILLKTINFFL